MSEEETNEQLPASSFTPLPDMNTQTIEPAEKARLLDEIQAKIDAIKAELVADAPPDVIAGCNH